MRLETFISEQIQYLASPSSDFPKPIAAFGVTPQRLEHLLALCTEQFKKIRQVLEKRRVKELAQLETRYADRRFVIERERNEIVEKYRSLISRYGHRDGLLGDIVGWESAALAPYDSDIKSIENAILNEPTELYNRIKDLELVCVSIKSLVVLKQRINEIREQYGDDWEIHNDFGSTPTKIRKEHSALLNEHMNLYRSRYLLVHDFGNIQREVSVLLQVVDRLLRKPMFIADANWGIVCFEPNYEFWLKQASDEEKAVIVSNFAVFDGAVGITPIENRMQDELRNRGIRFEFQHPIHGYVLDFFIESNGKRLNVECDGQEFHSTPEAIEHDRRRNNVMAANNILVLRFSGSDIWTNVGACVDSVEMALSASI